MGKRDIIRLEALALPEGRTLKMHCPYCEAPHEEKLYVTRLDGNKLAFECKRASCPAKGYITGTRGEGGNTPPKVFEPKPFKDETEVLSQELGEWLTSKYGIPRELFIRNGVTQSTDGYEIFFPVYREGKKIAVVSKNFRGYGKKTNTWKLEDVHLSYLPTTNNKVDSDILWVVEGCLDAIKVNAAGLKALALLGGHMPDSEMYKLVGTNVIVALDPDAVSAQRRLVKKLRAYTSVRDVFLREDPKDTSIEELKEYVKHCFLY